MLFIESGAMNDTLSLPRLPQGIDRLTTGGMNVLAFEDATVGQLLLANALRGALDLGGSCVLVTATEPREFIDELRLAGIYLEDDWRASRLRIVAPPDMAGRSRADALQDLLAGSDDEAAAPISLVILAELREMLSFENPQSCKALLGQFVGWSRQQSMAVLAFADVQRATSRERLTLTMACDESTGYALVRNIGARRVLEIRRWNRPAAAGKSSRAVAGAYGPAGAAGLASVASLACAAGPSSVELEWTARGELSAQVLPACAPLALAEAGSIGHSPSPVILAMRGSFAPSASAYAVDGRACDWYWAESMMALGWEAQRLAANAVVLRYADPRDFEAICSLVIDLRSGDRKGLHIFVRESGLRLRLPMALTLLQLGVTSIIADGLSDRSALIGIETALARPFSRICDTEALRVSVEYRRLLGSTPSDALEFRAAVERLLALTDVFDLRHSMVRLFVRPGCQQAALSRLAERGRDRLFAPDGTQLWLFLFACPRTDVRPVLDRLFGEDLQSLFTDWSVSAEPERMLTALESIRGARPRRVPAQALERAAA